MSFSTRPCRDTRHAGVMSGSCRSPSDHVATRGEPRTTTTPRCRQSEFLQSWRHTMQYDLRRVPTCIARSPGARVSRRGAPQGASLRLRFASAFAQRFGGQVDEPVLRSCAAAKEDARLETRAPGRSRMTPSVASPVIRTLRLCQCHPVVEGHKAMAADAVAAGASDGDAFRVPVLFS